MRNVRTPAAALLLAGSLLLTGSVFGQATPSRPMQKVHAVADLVTSPAAPGCGESCSFSPMCAPAGVWAAEMTRPRSTSEDKLIRLITSTVRPKCWAENGGECTVDYFPVGMGLVVHAPEDVQKEVGFLLESLRKKQDTQVAVTLKFITVSDDFFERFGLDFDLTGGPAPAKIRACRDAAPECAQRIGVDFGPRCDSIRSCCMDSGCKDCCKDGCKDKCSANDCCEKGCCEKPGAQATGLTEAQAQLLLEAIQGDRRACVTAAPRVTMIDGQAATVTTQEQQSYVTGVSIDCVNGEQRVMPKVTEYRTGLAVSMESSVSANGKLVSLNLKANHCYLENPNVQLFPVTYMVTPKFADGGKGQAIPVTQFIQQPKFKTLTVDTRLNVASGGTMLVYGGAIERMQPQERVPALSKIPYLSRLFRTVRHESTREHLLVMVTPTVQTPSVVETASAKCPAPCADAVCPAAATGGCRQTSGKSTSCPAAACTPSAIAATAPPCPDMMATPVAPRPLPTVSATAATTAVQRTTAKLMAMYQAACAKGDMLQAREFATMALDLDPTCFARPVDQMMPVSAPAPAHPMMMPMPMPPANWQHRRPAPPMPPTPIYQATPPQVLPPAAHPIQGRGAMLIQPQWQQRYRLVIERAPASAVLASWFPAGSPNQSGRLKLEPVTTATETAFAFELRR